jgi:hypothetical protein
MSRRIALIHATALSIEPIAAAFERLWPQVHRMNLLDDSLSVDRNAAGRLTPEMLSRFETLARYAQSAGCDAILFTCSAFGPAIEAAGRATGLPTLKPNEAMFEQALGLPVAGRPLRLGLVATFQPSIASMSEELQAMARERGVAIDWRTVFVPQAMDALAQGRASEHHRRVAEAARGLADCDAVMLAQFSMAAAAPEVQGQLPCPVLTSPDCAVRALMEATGSA